MTAYGTKIDSRPMLSWPIDTQVSVATTSHSATASLAEVVISTLPPVRAAIASARATITGSGWKPAGAPIRTCRPAVAPPSR